MNSPKTPASASPAATPDGKRFLGVTALTGAGLVLGARALDSVLTGGRRSFPVPILPNAIRIAVVGCGTQGQVLLKNLDVIFRERAIPVHLVAVCDIGPFALERALRDGRASFPELRGYTELEDLLAREKSLDAVFLATPDFLHAPQVNLCLRAGLHVYCESPMAHTLADARSMLRAARETGKLLQIGYQRRSNFNYRYTREILQNKTRLFGVLVGGDAHWYQRLRADAVLPPQGYPAADVLTRHGFANAHQFCNWRWFRKYSVGPLASTGAGQLDLFNGWFGRPDSLFVSAAGEASPAVENPGDVLTCLSYATPDGVVRARQHLRTGVGTGTESRGNREETILGDAGSIRLSERGRDIRVVPEDSRSEIWYNCRNAGLLNQDVIVSVPSPWRRLDFITAFFPLPLVPERKLPCQAHIENFFYVIRREPLTVLRCDAATALASEVPLYRINEAVTAGKIIQFTDADFAAESAAEPEPNNNPPTP